MPDERLAIEGGNPVRTIPWPAWPVLGEEDRQAVLAVIESGCLSSLLHPRVKEFEDAFAAYHGVRCAVATSSGTTALHTALAAAGVRAGDEVIVPAHTFAGTVFPVLHQGAVPVFADVDLQTFNMQPAALERLITPRTKALIPVHLNGHPADMDEIMALASRHGLVVIEDACQAHGATYRGRKVGTIAPLACFSFFEDKIMTAGGEGGMIVTDDEELAASARSIRNYGESPPQPGKEREYRHHRLGYNYRMTEMSAATGLVQLGQLDFYVARRRENAAYLTRALGDLPEIIPPVVREYVTHAFYKYIGRLNRERLSAPIEEFVAAVAAEGVPIARRYPTPLHRQPVFAEEHGDASCPSAERLADEAFVLTIHPTVIERDLDDLAAAIGKVVRAWRGR